MNPEQQQVEQDIWDEEATRTDADEPAPSNSAAEQPSPGESPANEASEQPAKQLPEGDPAPDVRQLIEQVSITNARVQDLAHQLSSANGRIGAMQRQLEAAKQAAPGGEGGPSATQINDAGKDPQKWKKLREDFPEWAEGIDEMVNHRINERLTQPQGQPASSEDVRASASEAVREAMVEDAHPNWKDTVRKPEFATWLQQQSDDIQKLASSPRAKDAIELLDHFSVHSSKPTADEIVAERNRRQQRNAAVKGQRGAIGIEEGAMTDEQYWNHLAKIEGAA